MNAVGWLLLFLETYFNRGTVIRNKMHIKKKKERKKNERRKRNEKK